MTPLASLLWLALGAAPCTPEVAVHGRGVEVVPDGRPLPDAVVDELQALAPGLFARAAQAVGLTSCPRIDVELLSAIEGAALLDPPWHLPPWAAGATVQGSRRIVVAVTAGGRSQDHQRVLLHELVHVAVAERVGVPERRLPRWLDEGIARVVANEDGGADLSALARARLANRLIPLAALDRGFPRRADEAQLAYAQSVRAVASILARGGVDALPRLLGRVAEGVAIDDALHEVTGRRLWQLDVDVQRSISPWRAIAVVGLEVDVLYAACALVVVWAGLRARRRIRDGILAMEDLPRARDPPGDVVLWRFRAG